MYSEHCEENFYLAQELKCIFKNERVNSSHIFGKHSNKYLLQTGYKFGVADGHALQTPREDVQGGCWSVQVSSVLNRCNISNMLELCCCL